MKNEIIIGICAGFLSYLVYRGYDITPLIILVLLGAFFLSSLVKGLVESGKPPKSRGKRELFL